MSRGKQDKELPHLMMVYGTLKRGFGNDRIFHQYGGKFAGTCTTKERYVLAGGGFPRLWNPPKEELDMFEGFLGRVKGELWRASDDSLAACDRLEGHPNWYKREEVTVQTGPESFTTAWLYIMQAFPGATELLTPARNGTLEWTGGTPYRNLAEYAR